MKPIWNYHGWVLFTFWGCILELTLIRLIYFRWIKIDYMTPHGIGGLLIGLISITFSIVAIVMVFIYQINKIL